MRRNPNNDAIPHTTRWQSHTIKVRYDSLFGANKSADWTYTPFVAPALLAFVSLFLSPKVNDLRRCSATTTRTIRTEGSRATQRRLVAEFHFLSPTWTDPRLSFQSLPTFQKKKTYIVMFWLVKNNLLTGGLFWKEKVRTISCCALGIPWDSVFQLKTFGKATKKSGIQIFHILPQHLIGEKPPGLGSCFFIGKSCWCFHYTWSGQWFCSGHLNYR